MTDIVQMTGAPERAYEVFVDVVKNLFEWDEDTGRGKFTLITSGWLVQVWVVVFIQVEQDMNK